MFVTSDPTAAASSHLVYHVKQCLTASGNYPLNRRATTVFRCQTWPLSHLESTVFQRVWRWAQDSQDFCRCKHCCFSKVLSLRSCVCLLVFVWTNTLPWQSVWWVCAPSSTHLLLVHPTGKTPSSLSGPSASQPSWTEARFRTGSSRDKEPAPTPTDS